MEHAVVWFEVLGGDGAGLRGFYGELFGWKYEVANDYGVVPPGGKGIPGGVGAVEKKADKHVTFYVSTPDIEASLAKVTKLGGRVLMPRTALPAGPTIAMFADVEGNAIGLVEGDGAS